MKIKQIITILLVTVISGCATMMGSAGVDWSMQNPGDKPNYEVAKEQAADAIKDILKAPESAQFRKWTPFFKTLYNYGLAGGSNYEPLWTLCAEVSATNSYGGAGSSWIYVKFRNGEPVQDELGIGESEYECTNAPEDPERVN